MTPWAWLRMSRIRWPEPDDLMIRSEVGPPGQTRDQAHSAVQAMLDADPALAPLAAIWRRGATDDTVYAGLHAWAILPHDGDPRAAAVAWVTEHGEAINRSRPGAVNIAHPPRA